MKLPFSNPFKKPPSPSPPANPYAFQLPKGDINAKKIITQDQAKASYRNFLSGKNALAKRAKAF